MKTPAANDYTPCGACGHWRLHHCKVRRPSKRQLKRVWMETGWQMEPPRWEGFEVGGIPHPCQHTLPDLGP